MGDSLLVMKFGGTSVGSAERMRGVADLAAESAATRPTIVVVSAMSKVTDLLLDTLARGEAGDEQAVEAGILSREALPPPASTRQGSSPPTTISARLRP